LLFSKDGKTLFSEGGGALRIWDADTGRERDLFPTLQHDFDSQMVLMPDGRTLLSLNQPSSGVQDTVHVWDIAQKKEVRTLLLPVRRVESSATRRNALSPNGSLGAINLPTEMRVFDLSTGRELCKLAKGGKEIRDVVFAGGDRLVTADAKQIIDVWEARTGKLVRRFAHGGPAEVLAASSDGRWLATLEHHTYAIDRQLDKDVIHVWNLKTGTKKQDLTARPKRWFMRMRFAPDGKRLVASSAGGGYEVTVWDVETGERVCEIDNLGSLGFAFSPAGERLAIVHGRGKIDLWDIKTGQFLSTEDPRHARATALAFSPFGEGVVLLGFSSLSTWETATGRRKGSFDLPPHNFTHPTSALSSDGRYALSYMGGWENCQPFVWDVADHRRLHLLKTSCQMGAFSPESTLLATWESGKKPVIRLREVETGQEVRSFPGSNGAFPYLSFTADGQTLLAADKKIVAYDVASGKERVSWQMKPVPDHSGVRIMVGGKEVDPNSRRAWRGFTASASGRLIAVTLNGGLDRQPLQNRIALFDARTGKLLRRWSDSGKPSSGYEQLSFSPDDQLLASSDGQVLHLWETATGKEIRTFRGHRGDIDFLAFSRDGRRLASTSSDSTVLIWDTTGQAGAATADAALEESWKALLDEDAGRAHRAVWVLARMPGKSIPLLKDRLGPVKAVGRERLDQLIKDLDSDQFAVREKALAELQKLDELAEPELRLALQGKPTLEQRRRIEPMLARLDAAIPSGEALRSLRAVRVLEHADTPEAHRLLRELATGAEGARLTREAQAALARLNRRSP
jgi:WD40 repeat protein